MIKEKISSTIKYYQRHPENIIKFFNVFSWLFLVYAMRIYSVESNKRISLLETYELTIESSRKNNQGGSWYDVFDGIMWICTCIGGIIIYGYLLS